MSSNTASRKQHNLWNRSWVHLRENLNFYRIHVLFFTFTPLIAAGIFYASNKEAHIAFIDALFVCVSSVTVTGLSTIDLSSVTPWQQVMLFILMCMGSPVTVSWLIVYVRRYYFARTFEHIIESQVSSAVATATTKKRDTRWSKGVVSWRNIKLRKLRGSYFCRSRTEEAHKRDSNSHRFRPDMIHRVKGSPELVDPSGLIRHGGSDPALSQDRWENASKSNGRIATNVHGVQVKELVPDGEASPRTSHLSQTAIPPPRLSSFDSKHHTNPGLRSCELPSETVREEKSFPREGEKSFPRSQTIEFVQPEHEHDQRYVHGRNHPHSGDEENMATSERLVEAPLSTAVRRKRGSIREYEGLSDEPASKRNNLIHEHLHRPALTRTETLDTMRSSVRPHKLRTTEQDFGGFPLPHIILGRLIRRFFPRLQQRLTRTVTIQQQLTIHSQQGGQTTVLGARAVPYISFDAIVGRNSTFRALTAENLKELGGVEYRALNMLLWVVGLYHVGIPLVAFVIIAPYISQGRWKDVFRPPQQHSVISPVWYSMFQVISAYTNTGTSLVDQSMIPFQKAYPEVLTLPFLILAGNTAFPVFLRFVIWFITKFVDKNSRSNETLHFLLDHPRRCFIYLFPSHQTWFLLTVLFMLTFTDWFFFLVLDIGNPAINPIPLGTRFAIGLLQATAVRSAGFGTVALSALVPAVKVLYVVMMYVSIYPIAMSVRSTNVYEERSLGVFEGDQDDDEDAVALGHTGTRTRIWGKYLAAHARKQLSFDMWWLAFALFLVCIVEKSSLQDENNASWFNIFTIIFELTSAYGTVGLSLGIPTQDYSFSGALRPLSKLIMCAVMLRGRHRGLPVAIDRAVILPAEFREQLGDENGEVHLGVQVNDEQCSHDEGEAEGE